MGRGLREGRGHGGRDAAGRPEGVAPQPPVLFAELEHVAQDNRVHVSQQGDLYFANVEERDSRSDYCCFAAFPRLRTIVQKVPMKLTVRGCKCTWGPGALSCTLVSSAWATSRRDSHVGRCLATRLSAARPRLQSPRTCVCTSGPLGGGCTPISRGPQVSDPHPAGQKRGRK